MNIIHTKLSRICYPLIYFKYLNYDMNFVKRYISLVAYKKVNLFDIETHIPLLWKVPSTYHGNTSDSIQNFADQYIVCLAHSSDPNPCVFLKLLNIYANNFRLLTKHVISYKMLFDKIHTCSVYHINAMNNKDLIEFSFILKKLKPLNLNFINNLSDLLICVCEKNLFKFDLQETLTLLQLLLQIFDSKIINRPIYDAFLKNLYKNDIYEDPEDLALVMYYIGLRKSSTLQNVALLQHLEENINKLSFSSVGLAISGVLKTLISYKPESLLIKCESILQNRLSCLSNSLSSAEENSFCNIMLFLSHYKYYDKDLFKHLSNFIINLDQNSMPWNFVLNCMLFYAMAGVYDKNLCCYIEEYIESVFDSGIVLSIKEISSVLWAFSTINHECKPPFLSDIAQKIYLFLKSGHSWKCFYSISDILLSLIILKHYPENFIKDYFELCFSKTNKGKGERHFERLALIATCLKIELPELQLSSLDSILSKKSFSTNASPKVVSAVHKLNEYFNAEIFKLCQVFDYIDYPSIIINKKGIKKAMSESEIKISHCSLYNCLKCITESQSAFIAVEILSSKMCLFQSLQPRGLIGLKHRLMKRSGWTFTTVSEDDIMSFNSHDCSSLLLQNICNVVKN